MCRFGGVSGIAHPQADKVETDYGGVGDHCDAVYYYPTEYLDDGVSVAWGGFVGGRVAGTTRSVQYAKRNRIT